MKALGSVIIAIFLTRGIGHSQILVGAGYDDPSVIRVAPGQVVPLFVTGLKTVLPAGMARANDVPLPTNLAGISAAINQTPQYSRPLPLLAIDQFNRCIDSTSLGPDCLVTAITVQIPFNISVPSPFETLFAAQITSLVISENGVPTKSFTLSPVTDQIHVLQSCDIGGQTRGTGVCYPLVTHLDGTLVLQAVRANGQPPPMSNGEARPGEVLTMYAYGLGAVSPVVEAGTASPKSPAAAASVMFLQFDYRLNASPSPPTLSPSSPATAQPLFAGLTPEQVGLYQINFMVPPPPADTPHCSDLVASNLTISITAAGGQSFSGAAICVDTETQ